VRQAQGLWTLWSGPSNFEDAIEGARAASVLAAPDDLRTRSYAQFLVGAASLARGRFHQAIEEFEGGVTLFTTVPADAEAAGLVLPIRANIRAWQAEAYAALGDFGPAVAAAGEARRIADELCHPATQGLAGLHAGYVFLLQGQIKTAAAAFESGLSSGTVRSWNSLGLSLAHFLLGRCTDGLEALARGLGFGGNPFGPQGKIVSRYGVILAEAYLAAGRLEDAEATAAQGLALATTDNARAYHVPLGRLRAEALALQGKGPASEEAFLDWRRLIELAKELSMRPEIAHCSLGLGKLYGRLGDRTSARKLLTTAVAMYREMAMGFWLEEGEAALERVG
jgi:tetratricopeptide (TPR) repeat protein